MLQEGNGACGGHSLDGQMIERMAMMSARLQARVDDCVPEIAHDLVEQVYPHLMRTIPATTIIGWSMRAGLGGRGEGCLVPRDTPIGSVALRGTRCLFRTTEDVMVLPLRITDVELDDRTPDGPQINVRVAGEPRALDGLPQDALRFYVTGDYGGASTLWLWCVRHCREVVITGDATMSEGGDARCNEVRIAGSCVRMGRVADHDGDQTDAPLWPNAGYIPEGLRLLQEYLHMPQAFLFFDVHGVKRAAQLVGQNFSITFVFHAPPRLMMRLHAGALRLHCVPAVNVFETTSEPIVRDGIGIEHVLRAADIDPAHAEVLDVRTVLGARKGVAERVLYSPLGKNVCGARGPMEVPGGHRADAYYRLRRATSRRDTGVDTFIRLMARTHDCETKISDEVLSVRMLCTNRALPRELGVGDVGHSVQGTPSRVTGINVGHVVAPVIPPLGSDALWSMFALLACARRTLRDLTQLRAMVALYAQQMDPDGVRDHHGLRNGAEALRSVTHWPFYRWIQGSTLCGTATRVDIDEHRFVSMGDAFVFGCVLASIWASMAPVNTLTQMQVRCMPSGREFVWPQRGGLACVL